MNDRYPKIWIGYLTGCLTLAAFAALHVLRPDETAPYTVITGALMMVMTLAVLIGIIYWFLSVYRLHDILREATGGTYPISPKRATWTQFIPFYNVYWMFKWTSEVAVFVNETEGRDVLGKSRFGWMLVGAAFVGRLFTGSYLLIAFSVLGRLGASVRDAIGEKPLPVRYEREKYKSSGVAIASCVVGGIVLTGLLVAITYPNYLKTQKESAVKTAAVQK